VPQDAPAARPAALHEPYRAKKQAEDGGDDRVAPAGFRGRAGPVAETEAADRRVTCRRRISDAAF
jgi:hypothetical protein